MQHSKLTHRAAATGAGSGPEMNAGRLQRRRMLATAVSSVITTGLAACGGGDGGSSSPPSSAPAPAPRVKSTKRGIAFDLASAADYAALAPGVSWWYDWSDKPSGGTVSELRDRYRMDFVPMLWNQNFNDAEVTQMLQANPQIGYLLALNEPNLNGQATRTPPQAAELWPRIEKIAQATGVKIVGPQLTWGNLAGYADPMVWMDEFLAAYRVAHEGRDPRIDYLGFHWYDYGLKDQLDRLMKYGKPFWVTELANWHQGDGNAAIDSFDKQMAQMTEMVALCESRADVFRYAWFTGRGGTDLGNRFTTLLGAEGELTVLGHHYLQLPA